MARSQDNHHGPARPHPDAVRLRGGTDPDFNRRYFSDPVAPGDDDLSDVPLPLGRETVTVDDPRDGFLGGIIDKVAGVRSHEEDRLIWPDE